MCIRGIYWLLMLVSVSLVTVRDKTKKINSQYVVHSLHVILIIYLFAYARFLSPFFFLMWNYTHKLISESFFFFWSEIMQRKLTRHVYKKNMVNYE